MSQEELKEFRDKQKAYSKNIRDKNRAELSKEESNNK